MVVDHTDYIKLLREVRALPKVKKVFVRSGLRYDYIMADKSDAFLRELCQYHVSGQLKVAPEHVSPKVLAVMGKPGRDVYDAFGEKYKRINQELGKEQYLVPYLISSHPGSDLDAAIELACYLKEKGIHPEQVQDFYPTPGTLSTAMFILDEAAMSFLGLGVPPEIATWGNILNAAQDLYVMQNYWWLWLPVGIVVSLFVISVNCIGDGLRDSTDPTQQG